MTASLFHRMSRLASRALSISALVSSSVVQVPLAAQDASAASSIVLVVEGLRGGGSVRAGAYGDAASWLGESGIVASCAPRVRGGRAECVLRLPGPGSYAVALFHDVDDDGVLDRGAFGIPTEGYGFSRNVGGGLSAPSFRDAALGIAAQPVRTVVRIRYGL